MLEATNDVLEIIVARLSGSAGMGDSGCRTGPTLITRARGQNDTGSPRPPFRGNPFLIGHRCAGKKLTRKPDVGTYGPIIVDISQFVFFFNCAWLFHSLTFYFICSCVFAVWFFIVHVKKR